MPSVCSDGCGRKTTKNSAGGGAHDDQGEEEQDQPQENVGGAQLGDRFLFQTLVLLLGEEALAGPVLQEFAGAQSLFAGCSCRVSRLPPEAARDQDQPHEHGDSGNDEIAQDSGKVIDVAEEHRADAHVAVDGGISNEGKLPARQAPGERRATGDKQSEKPQRRSLRRLNTPESNAQKRTLAAMFRYVPKKCGFRPRR